MKLALTRPVRHIAIHPGGWIIAFPPTNATLNRAVSKSFPEASYRQERTPDTNLLNYWFVPEGEGVETRIQAFAEGIEVDGMVTRFEFTDAARSKLETRLADAEASRLLSERIAPTKDIVVPDLLLPLRPYQLAALEYGETRDFVYIADQAGVGKTPSAIGWVHWRNLYPAVVVVPANARTNWGEEYHRFLGDAVRVKVLPPTPRNFNVEHDLTDWAKKGKSVVVTSYNGLHEWLPYLRPIQWASAVLDEAHYIRKRSARRSRAALEFLDGIPRRLFLSGTPQERDTRDFEPQLAGLGVADKFRGYVALTGKATKPDHLAFNRRLSEVCMIRRKKKDVLEQLPELNEEWRAIDVDEVALKAYMRAEDEFLKEYSKNEGERIITPMGTLRRLVGEAKIEPVLEWMEPMWATDAVPIIFCYHHSVMNGIGSALESAGISTVRYDGTMTSAQKDRARISFQGGSGRCLIAQLTAAGVALNLQRADTIVFTELDWLPTSHEQAMSRAHRSGSKHESVNVSYLYSPRTIDEDMRLVLGQRAESIGVTVDGELGGAKAVFRALKERRGR